MHIDGIGEVGDYCNFNPENPVVRDELWYWQNQHTNSDDNYLDDEFEDCYLHVNIYFDRLTDVEVKALSQALNKFPNTEYLDNDQTIEFEVKGWLTHKKRRDFWETIYSFDVDFVTFDDC